MPEGKTATYGLNLDSNAAETARAAAKGLDEFEVALEKSSKSVKDMSTVLRALKGSSDETKEARKKLKAAIDEERGAVSAGTLALLKNGASLKGLAEAQRKASAATKEASGPIADAKAKVNELTESLSTGTGRMNLAAAGAIALGGAIVYLGVKALEGAYSLGKFLVTNADLARNMGLAREAAAGGAENAKNLGEQIDQLAAKIPTSTEELNKLAISITKSMSGGTSRANGQTIVDTLNAVAEAAAAADEETGRALQDIITRGQRVGRISLNPFELQGKYNTGFEDISKALAKNMKVGVDQAKIALATGRVTLDQGAKAIRDAVEGRFGEINAKKLISLDSLSTKLHDNWVNLTKGVDLEGMLRPLSKVVDMFSVTQYEGYAIRELFTGLGKDLGKSLDGGADLARVAIDSIIDVALDLEYEWLSNKKSIKELIASTGGLDEWKKKISVLVDDAHDLADAVMSVVHAIQGAAGAVGWVSDKLGKGIGAAVFAVSDRAANVEAKRQAYGREHGFEAGDDMAAGMAAGMRAGAPAVAAAGAAAAAAGVAGARGPAGLDAHSPSRKGIKAGQDFDEGVAIGAGGGAAAAAMTAAATPPRGAAAASVSATSGSGEIHIHFHVDGGRHAEENVAALQAPSFMSEMTRAVRHVLQSQGIPTQQPGTP
ncbi:MAG TPA: hypothetical protein VKU41_18095 [Polyangiaceae bacterium]|nr:hypothetical protein [Polyangiaceae bacterium]